MDRQPVFLPSLVWLLALGAALFAIFLRGSDILPLLPIFAAASVPALLGLFLARIADREWVQLLLMLAWAGLALMGCLTFGFRPMALLFITVPALACLFEREKVLEGTIIAALIAGIIWFAARQGYLPEAPSWRGGIRFWTTLSAMAALLAFGLATLFGAAARRTNPISSAARFAHYPIGVKGLVDTCL